LIHLTADTLDLPLGESWIASIILVLNLVKLAGVVVFCQIAEWLESFSARYLLEPITVFQQTIK
jgi:hypothetical protein